MIEIMYNRVEMRMIFQVVKGWNTKKHIMRKN